MEVCITHSDATYIDRLLEHYLQAGVIEREWIPGIRERALSLDRVFYIPWREGIKFDGVEYCFAVKSKDGTERRGYPVSRVPWATWLREGEPGNGGLCLWMPEAFFEAHGRDGLPL